MRGLEALRAAVRIRQGRISARFLHYPCRNTGRNSESSKEGRGGERNRAIVAWAGGNFWIYESDRKKKGKGRDEWLAWVGASNGMRVESKTSERSSTEAEQEKRKARGKVCEAITKSGLSTRREKRGEGTTNGLLDCESLCPTDAEGRRQARKEGERRMRSDVLIKAGSHRDTHRNSGAERGKGKRNIAGKGASSEKGREMELNSMQPRQAPQALAGRVGSILGGGERTTRWR